MCDTVLVGTQGLGLAKRGQFFLCEVSSSSSSSVCVCVCVCVCARVRYAYYWQVVIQNSPWPPGV